LGRGAERRNFHEYGCPLESSPKCGDLIRVPLDRAAEALSVTPEEDAPIMKALEAEALYPDWDKTGGREQ
jgi:hypothetical protein